MIGILMNEYIMRGAGAMWLMYMAIVLFGAAVYGVGCLAWRIYNGKTH